MVHLLQLEWLKFRKNVVFQVLGGLYLLLLPMQLMAVKSMNISIPGLTSNMLVQFPTVWSFLAYTGSWLVYFFWGFFAIFLMSNEFSQKTFRQNIISGLTRAQIYVGKFEFVLLLCILSTAYYALWAILFGMANTTDDSSFGPLDRIDMIPRYLLMNLGYMSLGIFFAVLSRKTAMSVFLYFAYTLFLEPMIRWMFHRRIFDGRSMHFYPANAFEDLTPLPLGDVSFTRDLVEQGEAGLYLSGSESVVTSLIYIMLLWLAGYWLVKSKDL
ncbi:MAG: ABC transporter permease [Saprospiraceae bacterium]|nr:ABC transporter permease [Saprospiraceae bacterium]